jgi:hypothetical protein
MGDSGKLSEQVSIRQGCHGLVRARRSIAFALKANVEQEQKDRNS